VANTITKAVDEILIVTECKKNGAVNIGNFGNKNHNRRAVLS